MIKFKLSIMILTKCSPLVFFIISVVIIIGLYNFSMNSGFLTSTDPLVVYATTTTITNNPHSEHMSGMNHNPSNTIHSFTVASKLLE